METNVVPWMSKEETERMVRELNEWARARRSKNAAAAQSEAASSAPVSTNNEASVTMHIGSL